MVSCMGSCVSCEVVVGVVPFQKRYIAYRSQLLLMLYELDVEEMERIDLGQSSKGKETGQSIVATVRQQIQVLASSTCIT